MSRDEVAGAVLLDTGPLVAILSASDTHHNICVDQLRLVKGPLVTCWPVVTEAAWLLRGDHAGIAALMSGLERGPFTLAALTAPDIAPIGAILTKYRDLGLQLADAAIIHLANREGLDDIFTLDRRDFSVVRKARGKKFRLLPGIA